MRKLGQNEIKLGKMKLKFCNKTRGHCIRYLQQTIVLNISITLITRGVTSITGAITSCVESMISLSFCLGIPSPSYSKFSISTSESSHSDSVSELSYSDSLSEFPAPCSELIYLCTGTQVACITTWNWGDGFSTRTEVNSISTSTQISSFSIQPGASACSLLVLVETPSEFTYKTQCRISRT